MGFNFTDHTIDKLIKMAETQGVAVLELPFRGTYYVPEAEMDAIRWNYEAVAQMIGVLHDLNPDDIRITVSQIDDNDVEIFWELT